MKAKTIASMPEALSSADLVKAIDKVCKDSQTLQARIQVVGVQALMHLGAHGDIGPVNRLLVGLGKGTRRSALGSWLLAHGGLVVNDSMATRKTAPLKYSKDKQTSPEAALADPWFDHLPEKEISDVFDLQKAIHAILGKCAGKQIKVGGKVLGKDVASDALKALAVLGGEEGYTPSVLPVAEDALM